MADEQACLVQLVRRLFLQLCPVKDILNEIRNLNKLDLFRSYEFQNALAAHVLKDTHATAHPPPGRYTHYFLKAVCEEVTACPPEEGLSEELLDVCLKYKLDPALATSTGYRTFLLDNLNCHITLSTTMQIELVGLVQWEAGYRLTEFITAFPDLFRGSRVLELGTGSSPAGVALHYVPARAVLLTDYHPSVLAAIQQNLECNSVSFRSITSNNAVESSGCKADVFVGELNWQEDVYPAIQAFSPDFIIGADLVYDPSIIEPLLCTVRSLLGVSRPPVEASPCPPVINVDHLRGLRSRGPFFLLAQTLRNPTTLDTFLRSSAQKGICVNEVAFNTEGAAPSPFSRLITNTIKL
eukprot:CAMPEP_0177667538 /NCGR_PEP_ID=MMETSP0447-20121125/22176_1 /TAXON_ID=0 /ORGANISM="Stygamoeba regulata, Strain BSH-02190019" /LENGTH=352 /DNA_ID=CAMNT_0019173775 /DNA_START=34 /DNA_END=1088 /DNA_ORIENTATION=-